MSKGPQATFDYLAKSQNRAATELLIATLQSKHPAVLERGVAALMDRLDPDGHREVFRRLMSFDQRCREIIQRRAQRLETVVTAALRETDVRECQTACQAIVALRLYDTLPGLVTILTDEGNPHSALAAQTILCLSEALYEDLSQGDGASASSVRTDADTVRRRVTTALEEGARKFYRHKRREAVEAFLLVAKPQNPTLRQLLRNPDDACHKEVIDVLMENPKGGIIRLLLGFLDDPQLPRPIIDVLTSRRDKRFVEHLLRRVGSGDSRLRGCSETLARFESLAWAKPDDSLFPTLDDEDQASAVRLIMATGMSSEKKLEAIGRIVQDGKPAGRRAAAQALGSFKTALANEYVIRAISDEDPEVRAHALRQLRPRGIPGAMTLLIRMVDSPHDVVKEALRDALPEFSFRQFMLLFDDLPEEFQSIAGHLVQKIDPDAAIHIAAEMKVLSPVRRRRAVQAASAMGLVKRLEKFVAELVTDEDHMVRAAAAVALAEAETSRSWEALRDALLDRSVIVQEAAEQSLNRISQAFLYSAKRQLADRQPPGAPIQPPPGVPSQLPEEAAP